MNIKSDRAYTLKSKVKDFLYVDVQGNCYPVQDHLVKMPRRTAIIALKISDNFEFVCDEWEWGTEDTKSTVLLLRSGGLGDILMVTPMIEKLNSLGAEVTLATETRYFDLIDPTFCQLMDITKYPQADLDVYDAIVDLHLYVENAEWDKYNKTHRAQLFADSMHLNLNGNYELHIKLPTTAMEPIDILYVPRSSCNARNWTTERNEKIVKRLKEYYNVEVASSYETIAELVAKVKSARLVIAPDTGVFHIAQALGIPIITYFGSFPIERRWAAPSKVVNLITTKCDQMPCLEYNCPLTPESGNVISPCIDIPIETLLHEVYELLPVTVA